MNLFSSIPIVSKSPPMTAPFSFWIGFNVVVLILLVLDLTVFHRNQREASTGKALLTTLAWVALSIGFGLWILWSAGREHGLQFFAGYLIEYALSMDNIFIFVLVFTGFKIAPQAEHRILFWGVLGALILRGLMILLGVALIQRFSWITYIFGAYIIYTGLHLLFSHPEAADVNQNFAVKLVRRFLPLTLEAPEGKYLVRERGRWHFTILALALLVIEITDLIFALDSIPAVFAVTRDPFIVYTSNVCAILGLRSLYFLLAGAMKSLVYLHTGLAAVLTFIGGKMVAEPFWPISTEVSLAIFGGLLGLTVVASLLKSRLGGTR